MKDLWNTPLNLIDYQPRDRMELDMLVTDD